MAFLGYVPQSGLRGARRSKKASPARSTHQPGDNATDGRAEHHHHERCPARPQPRHHGGRIAARSIGASGERGDGLAPDPEDGPRSGMSRPCCCRMRRASAGDGRQPKYLAAYRALRHRRSQTLGRGELARPRHDKVPCQIPRCCSATRRAGLAWSAVWELKAAAPAIVGPIPLTLLQHTSPAAPAVRCAVPDGTRSATHGASGASRVLHRRFAAPVALRRPPGRRLARPGL